MRSGWGRSHDISGEAWVRTKSQVVSLALESEDVILITWDVPIILISGLCIYISFGCVSVLLQSSRPDQHSVACSSRMKLTFYSFNFFM